MILLYTINNTILDNTILIYIKIISYNTIPLIHNLLFNTDIGIHIIDT